MGRSRAAVVRVVAVTVSILLAALAFGLSGIASAGSGPVVGSTTTSGATGGKTSYNVGAAPVLDGVLDGPYNTSEGDTSGTPGIGLPYYEQQGATGATSLLFPTYTPSQNPTYETTIGGITAPNLAVYPTGGTGPSGQTGETVPYASGVAGTPGPDDDYCTKPGGANPESGPVNTEPPGVVLPFSPYYFPDVVRNADGSLTGYFDYRPKDTDEAVTVASSTDGGVIWTTQGEALEQNAGYCPNADTNDDGQGHPFVVPVGATTDLYTLQRAAGDNTGIGLLVHKVNPSASNPLSTLPASEPVGIDPNTFATASTTVGATGSAGATIPVSTLGSNGSPEQIVAGSYEDVPVGSTAPSSSTLINCTGPTSAPGTAGPGSLTGCTSANGSPVSVNSGDDLIQVIATANPLSTSGSTPCQGANTVTVPAGPNNAGGTGGLSAFCFTVPSTSPVGPITAYWWGSLAPDRVYVDGHAMYCNSVSSGLVKFENCTSPTGPFTVTQGDAITADPITPPTATMTTGLLAPDGIIGALPNYTSSAAYASNGGEFNGHSVPNSATVLLYTEKLANWFIEGTTNGYITAPGNYKSGTVTLPLTGTTGSTGATGQMLNYQPSVTTTEPLPDEYPATGSFTVYAGVTDSNGNFIQSLNCVSWEPGSATPGTAPPVGSINLIGCTNQGTSAETIASGTDVGGPGAAIVPYSVIGQTGEGKNGKTSGPTELFGNNEDYEVVRAAYTTNGINFTDLGVISGSSSGTGSTSGNYNDISNPDQQASPLSNGTAAVTSTPTSQVTPCGGTGEASCQSPADLTPGSTDTVELRWPGSRGTIIQNPDGSYGMFLSGGWPTDADSDAFGQTFYTSSTDGIHWTTPQVVLSTDYTFSASATQDNALAHGVDLPLGISAYYSGRAYGPAVVQNPDGTLTMVFAGYRVPKGMPTSGQVLGTNAANQWTIGQTDPALYRDILTMTISSQTTPAVATTSVVSNSGSPNIYGSQATYTDTVSVNAPGIGIPTGTVDFYDGGNPISACQNVSLSDSPTDTATCQTTPGAVGTHTITATYTGDSNFASSTNSPGFAEQVSPAALTITASSPSMTYGGPVPTVTAGYAGFENGDSASSLASQPTCSTTAGSSSPVSSSPATSCSGASDSNYTISYVGGSVTVDPAALTAYVSATQSYGGTPTFSVDSYGGFENSDDASVVSGSVSCSTTVTSATTVGTYTGTLSGCGGLSAASYTISYADDGVTVSPAALTITASSPSMTYGGPVPTVTAGYAGFQNSDSASSLASQPTCSTTAGSSSPVGSSPTTSCSGASDPNYTISYVDGNVIVNPAALTAYVSGTQTYGGTPSSSLDSYGGFENSDDASVVSGSVSCSTTVTSATPVGTYTGTLRDCGGLSAANYTISYADDGVTVNPAALTITASSPSMTYGGPVPTVTAGYTGFENSDSASSLTSQPTCSTTATTSSPVISSPTTSCSGATDSNYTISYSSGSVTVGPAALTAYVSGTQTYGGSPSFSVDSYGGFENGDDARAVSGVVSCSTTVSATSAVAFYTGTLSDCGGLSAANYTISYGDDGVTVSPAALTITASSPSMTYGGSAPAVTAGYAGFQNSDSASSLASQPTCSTTAGSSSQVGSSPTTSCSGASDPNYTISYVDGSVTVDPAALTASVSGTQTYGGTPGFTVDGYSGFENGDGSSVVSGSLSCSTTVTSATTVGTYTGTIGDCGGLTAANYTISYADGSLQVTPAALTITASSPSMTYGGTVPAITAGYSGFKNGDSASSLTTRPTCSTTAKSSSTVGGSPYPTTCSGASDPNYTISYVKGGVTIDPAQLTITASSPSITYGAAIPTITASYSGFVNGQGHSSLTAQPTCSTTATSTSPVSGSPYATTCSGASDPNYSIAYVAGNLTVKPAALKITASSASMTYGASVPAITPSYSGFVNDQSSTTLTTQPTCSTTASSSSSVAGSPYPTNCSGAVDPNYTISYVAGDVTVKAAALKITASSETVTYGAAVPAITATYSGFESGDSASSLTKQPTCSTTASSSSTVAGSPYPSTCSGALDTNYTISYSTGKVTVKPAPLTITASSASMTYGGSVPAITAGFSGFVNDDSANSLTTKPTCSTTASSSSSVAGSPYATKCTGAVDSNYTIKYVAGELTVNPATTTLTYTGPTSVLTTSTFTPTARLSSSAAACESDQTVSFALNSDPLTGASSAYTLETAKTGSAGSASGAAIATGRWKDGDYTITVNYAGTGNCDGTSTSTGITVAP